ncbi:MAG: hypothetical protein ABIR70_12935 [Bryobacteraceae bacterium]
MLSTRSLSLRKFWTVACFAAVSIPLWSQSYTLTTIAGADHLGDGKQATTVPLREPFGVAQDAAGNIYIADQSDHRIRRVDANGVITTIAGTGRPDYTGDGGPATAATFFSPRNLRLDGKGNLFVCDYNNGVIRKIDLTTGIITTVAGNGTFTYNGENIPATQSGMSPFDLAIDSDGNLYIADGFNHRVRRVNASDGKIQTVAGIGVAGYSGNNSAAITAAFNFPLGVAVDAQKNLYIADYLNNRIRKVVAATGIVTSIAGIGIANITGNGGLATSATLLYPHGVLLEPNGDILIGGDYDVRRITVSTGIIRNVAQYLADYGFAGDGGLSDKALFSSIGGISVAANGDILIADTTNYRVRRVRSGIVNTVAGVGLVNDVPAASAFLSAPAGLALNGTGGLLLADRLFNQIRSVAAGRVNKVFGDGYATAALTRVSKPEGIARDRSGFIYIADTQNSRILRMDPTGATNVFAGGRGYGYNGNFGQATGINLAAPLAVTVDAAGAVYIADTDNCRVRKVVDGVLSTIAGSASCVYSGDDGPATSAGIIPWDIALDNTGGLLIADGSHHRVRRVDLTTGIITTIAGIGTAGHTGDGGPATQAQVNDVRGITVDSAGRVYFAEYGVSMVRMIQNGTIRTVAGTGPYVSSADSGPATAVAFDPVRLIADTDGSIYISDEYNDKIRKLALAVPANLTVVQGAGATGAPASKVTVQVRLTEASGISVAATTVRFAVASGTAQLSSASAATTSAGIAQVEVSLGSTLGPVTITASSDGVPSVNINLTITAPSAPVPQLDDAAIVGAGLSVPSVRALSTGGIMSAFGRNFGVGATFRKVGESDLVNGKVPTVFAGICVDISGSRAPVFGASDTQVNFQVPAGLSGSAAVKIITKCGAAGETATNVITVPVQSAAPEFFYFTQSLNGKNPVAATDTITGALRASPTLFPGSGIAAPKPGSYVTIYATGFGDTDPSFTPGDFPPAIGRAKGNIRVLLNGTALPAENVLYAGVTPNSPGLYQLNLLIPAGTTAGDLSLVIEIAGIQSPAGAYLTVGAP